MGMTVGGLLFRFFLMGIALGVSISSFGVAFGFFEVPHRFSVPGNVFLGVLFFVVFLGFCFELWLSLTKDKA